MPTLFRHFATNLCSKFCLCLLSPDKRRQRRQPTSIRAAHIYPKQTQHNMASDQLCELRAGTSVQVRHWHHFVTYLSSFSILFAFGGRDTWARRSWNLTSPHHTKVWLNPHCCSCCWRGSKSRNKLKTRIFQMRPFWRNLGHQAAAIKRHSLTPPLSSGGIVIANARVKNSSTLRFDVGWRWWELGNGSGGSCGTQAGASLTSTAGSTISHGYLIYLINLAQFRQTHWMIWIKIRVCGINKFFFRFYYFALALLSAFHGTCQHIQRHAGGSSTITDSWIVSDAGNRSQPKKKPEKMLDELNGIQIIQQFFFRLLFALVLLLLLLLPDSLFAK